MGIFPEQGSNLRLLLRQGDSFPLSPDVFLSLFSFYAVMGRTKKKKKLEKLSSKEGVKLAHGARALKRSSDPHSLNHSLRFTPCLFVVVV